MTLKDKLVEFLANHAKELRDIYEHFNDEKESTIRGRLNENIGKCFKRIERGVYIATAGETQALLIEGDAWKVLDNFEDDSFDAIITDPPYSALDEQMQTGSTRKRNLNKGWDFETNDIDETLYAKMLRVLKPGGHFFCFMPASKHDTIDYIHDQVKTAEKAGFTFNAQWVWDKKHVSLGYNGRPRHELIMFFSKGKRHMYPAGHPMRRTPDVLEHPRIMSKKEKVHQTEKPIALIMDLVEFSTLPGDTVLDPFAGSFSLGMAATLTGRNSVGIEMNTEFARAGINRMREKLWIFD